MTPLFIHLKGDCFLTGYFMLLYSYIVAKREASEYSFSFFFHSFMHNPGL